MNSEQAQAVAQFLSMSNEMLSIGIDKFTMLKEKSGQMKAMEGAPAPVIAKQDELITGCDTSLETIGGMQRTLSELQAMFAQEQEVPPEE